MNLSDTDNKDVFNRFNKKAITLKENGQIKTAEGYETTVKAFSKFTNSKFLSFNEIDKKFLSSFESYMLKRGKSITTVGIYLRYLRAIYNEAVEEKIISPELYPFGKGKYQIPRSLNTKKALDEVSITKILKYEPKDHYWEDYAKDMWMLSLFCQGMNLKDFANLKFKNISGDKIVFIREKTKQTKRNNQAPITVYLSKQALSIINKWKNKNTSSNNYVFDIYSSAKTPQQNLRAVEQKIKMINKYIRQIAENLNIEQDITFYAARHSFATSLKRHGRSIEEILEFLGHADKKTTERYLASFGYDHKRSIIEDFVKQISG